MARRLAFTLSEVLITLVILGVIAAFTIPTIIAAQQRRELETRFKNTVAILSETLGRMSADNPELNDTYCKIDVWQDRFGTVFVPDFAKYVKYSKIYTERNFTRDLKNIGYNRSYFLTSNNEVFNQDFHLNGAVVLENGATVFSGICGFLAGSTEFLVDTNGSKGPNKFGLDVFYFQISNNNKLIPLDGGRYNGFPMRLCTFSATEGFDNGCGCSKYAALDKFPEDETKSYWANIPLK